MNALVLLLAGLLFIMSLALFVWTKKQLKSFQQKITSGLHNNTLNSELVAINAGSIGLGERFIKLEKHMRLLSERLDEMASDMNSNSAYSYAIELAQKATPAETIAELCHISLTEAQLLLMLHYQDKAA